MSRIKSMQEELQRLSELPQKVAIYITHKFIPVGYIEIVEEDYIRFREELDAPADPFLTIPIENIKYLRERK